MTKPITEALVEKVALGYFSELGYSTAYGADIAPGALDAEIESDEGSHEG